MSDDTPRLKLAQLVSLQEANAETWNEALAKLDALFDLCLLGQYENTPPANPADGDAYLTGAAPQGVWTGEAYKIAYCLDGGWRFAVPFDGLRAYLVPSGAFVVYRGGLWTDTSALLGARESSLAAAGLCDIGAAESLFIRITGTTAITDFGTAPGSLRFVRFADALLLAHNPPALHLLGALPRQTAPEDCALYASDAAGHWREIFYHRAAVRLDGLSTDGDGRLLLNGQTAAYSVTNNNTIATPALQLTGVGTEASILFGRFAPGGGPARFTFAKSRGPGRGDYAALADSDILGQFSFNGADGVAFREGAWLRAMADGPAIAGSVAGKLAFGTAPQGSSLPIDWLTIRHNGDIWVGAGNTQMPACKLDVDGPVRVKAYPAAALPDAAAGEGQIIFVRDESGGPVLAFSDGTVWRRVTDRAVVS